MKNILKTPSILIKTKESYAMWFGIFADFPKIYRYNLGGKIEECFLILLDNMFSSVYLPRNQKIMKLTSIIIKLDSLKFFLQLAWENKCISNNKYAELSEKLDEIGKMLGGWKRGLENSIDIQKIRN
jgi:hypothetical protein